MDNLISLDTFCGGALLEKTNASLRELLGNMQDPNTPWKKSRELDIKIIFTQNEDRDDAEVAVAVTTKRAPVTALKTRMSIGKDLRTGNVYAEEYGKQVKGQLSFADLETPEKVVMGEDVVDTETGEVTGKVMDFRQAQA